MTVNNFTEIEDMPKLVIKRYKFKAKDGSIDVKKWPFPDNQHQKQTIAELLKAPKKEV